MDTFFEQIVPMRKTGGNVLSVLGLWVLAFIIVFALVVFGGYLGPFSFLSPLLVFGVLYGAYKLSGKFNIEYEYIITNGTMDVDKIINKSSRKRITSVELSGVSRLEKYNPNLLANVDKQRLVFACNPDDPDAYFMVCEREGKSSITIVFAPETRLKEALVKFIPKFIANSAFK